MTCQIGIFLPDSITIKNVSEDFDSLPNREKEMAPATITEVVRDKNQYLPGIITQVAENWHIATF